MFYKFCSHFHRFCSFWLKFDMKQTNPHTMFSYFDAQLQKMQKNFAHVIGRLSRLSCMRTPGSEDPHRREQKFLLHFWRLGIRIGNIVCVLVCFISNLSQNGQIMWKWEKNQYGKSNLWIFSNCSIFAHYLGMRVCYIKMLLFQTESINIKMS